MNIKSLLGYILALAGVAGLAIVFVPESSTIVTLPEKITVLGETTIMVISGILIILGIFLIMKKGNLIEKSAEVPIYRGKQIVGYRRN